MSHSRSALVVFALLGCACNDCGNVADEPPVEAGPAPDCEPSRADGCEDCNPCTAMAWCDPAQSPPAVDVPSSSWVCAPLPPDASPRCFGAPLTSAPDVVNDCFPVAEAGSVDDVEAGHCCAGVCSRNDHPCPNYGDPGVLP